MPAWAGTAASVIAPTPTNVKAIRNSERCFIPDSPPITQSNGFIDDYGRGLQPLRRLPHPRLRRYFPMNGEETPPHKWGGAAQDQGQDQLDRAREVDVRVETVG